MSLYNEEKLKTLFLLFQPVLDVSKEYMLSSHPLTVEANLDKGVSDADVLST